MRIQLCRRLVFALQFIIIFMTLTYLVKSQSISTVDAIQNLKIDQMSTAEISDRGMIDRLTVKTDTLSDDMSQAIGAMKLLGIAVLALQGLQILSIWKKAP